MTAAELIERLGLARHPEGGWYRETWRAPATGADRPASTAILFLLQADERSHWHTVDADEIWLWHAGGPLRLDRAAAAEGPVAPVLLGPDLAAGQTPQGVVPAGHWQAATPLGGWTLVSCVVAPGFDFSGFTLAPPAFDIPGG